MNNTDILTAQSRRDYTLLTVGFSLRSGDARTARALRSGETQSARAAPITHTPLSERAHHSKQYDPS